MKQIRLTKTLASVCTACMLSTYAFNGTLVASASVAESQVLMQEASAPSFDQRQALKLLNDDRKDRGLPPLRFNSQLAKLADSYARDMIKRDYFSHYDPDGQSPFERMQKQEISFNYAGENLAFNESVLAAQQAFMHSPVHKANILNTNYTQVGIGVVKGPAGRVYVVQEFIDG